MINQELLNYIIKSLREGIAKDQVKQSLLASGWQEKDIEDAFSNVVAGEQSPLPVMPRVSYTSPLPKTSTRFSMGGSFFSMAMGIIGGLILVGGGVFAFIYFFGELSPEEVFSRSIATSSRIRSLAYSGEVTIETEETNGNEPLTFFVPFKSMAALVAGLTEPPSGEPPTSVVVPLQHQSFKAQFAGASDASDPQNPKGFFAVTFTAQDALALDMEMRNIGKAFYVKLNDLTMNGGEDEMFSSVVNTLQGTWIKVDPDALVKKFGGADEKLIKKLEEAQNTKPLSSQEIEALTQAFLTHKPLSISSLPIETIDGVSSFHYKITLDKEGVKAYIQELLKLFKARNYVDDQDVKNIEKSLNDTEFDTTMAAVLQAFEGEVWIGTEDFMVRKIQAVFDTKNIPAQERAFLNSADALASVTLAFKDFNKPVVVEVPSPIKTIEEIMKELPFFSMMSPQESEDTF